MTCTEKEKENLKINLYFYSRGPFFANRLPFSSLKNFVNKKVGNQKSKRTIVISFKS